MKLARTLAALCALTTAFTAAARAQAVIGPRTSSIPVSASGDTIVIPVVADLAGAGGASLGSVTARLQWRASTLRFLGMSAGTFGAPAVNLDSAAGTLRFAAASAAGATGTPTILNARFQATGPLGDTTLLGIVVTEMSAAGSLAAISNVATSALICVGSVAGRWGDVTGDDAVMSNDALGIVTHAVGLAAPPLTALNGDVDSSGSVTTRDALIVLSFAVGLNTSAFRVNNLKPSLCGAGSPVASLTLTPGTAQLLPGDQLPLAVVARDATSAVMHTGRISFVSTNPLVATVDAAGRVTGVAAGSADVIAILSPLIADTANVTVGGTRNVWYVSAGAGNAVEHGSAAYPFSTIAQALAAAQVDDTIRLATGDYGEPLRIRRPVTVLGDSTAQGFPRVRPAAGAGVDIDSVGTGTVILRRVEVPSTDGGVRARGAGGLLEIDRVRITGSRSAGIIASGFGTVLVTEGGIFGATDTGIDVDSTADVQIHRVTVDQIAGRSTSAPAGFTLRVRTAGNLTLDSVLLNGGKADVFDVTQVAVTRSRIGNTTGRGLTVKQADSIHVFATQFSNMRSGPADSSGLEFQAVHGVILDSIGVAGSDAGITVMGPRVASLRRVAIQLLPGSGRALTLTADTVWVVRANLAGGDAHLAPTGASFTMALVDTVTLQGGAMNLSGFGFVHVRDVVAADGVNELVRVANADRVLLERIEARGAGFTQGYAFGPYAIHVIGADTVTADSLWIHDNAAGALAIEAVDSASVSRTRAIANYGSLPSSQRATTLFQGNRRMRISRTLVDDRSGNAIYSMYFSAPFTGGHTAVDSSTILGPFYGVYAIGQNTDTLRVERSIMRPASPTDRIVIGTAVGSTGTVVIDGNTIDSAQMGMQLSNVRNVTVANNTLNGIAGYGMLVQGSGASAVQLQATGNLVDCDTSSNAPGIFLSNAPSTATGNTVRGCPVGIQLNSFGIAYAAIVRNNTVSVDSLNGSAGIYVGGSLSRPVVAQNIVTGGLWALGGIYGAGGTFDSLRVDSNVVRRGRGNGIHVAGTVFNLQIRGNRVDSVRIRDTNDIGEASIRLAFSGNVARIAHDTLRGHEVSGIFQEIFNGDTLRIDSTVVVDHPRIGIKVNDSNTRVAGFRNFIARNGWGLRGSSGTVTISQSTFENSDTAAVDADGASWDLTNNYWGHSSGPRCGVSCPGALGDSVVSFSNFTPFLTAPDPGTPLGVRMNVTVSAAGAPVAQRRASPGAVGQVIDRRRPEALP